MCESEYLDLYGDETTLAHGRYVEEDIDTIYIFIRKTVLIRGGQTMIIFDAKIYRPGTYLSRHKLHKIHDTFSTIMGEVKVKLCIEKINPLVVSEDIDTSFGRKFPRKTHVVCGTTIHRAL